MADLTVAGSTSYPATLDTASTVVDGPTGTDQVAAQVNGPAAAAVAIETELGVQPRGTATDVRTRLDRGIASAGTLLRSASAWGTSFGDGDIWIGSAASNSMELSRLNMGQGLSVAYGAHSTTIYMTSLAGTAVATQAQVEAATDLVNIVPAGRMQYHPGVAKFWLVYYGRTNVTGASHNVTTVTDLGTGNYRITFTTAFSSASYAVLVSAMDRIGQTKVLSGLQLGSSSAASCNVSFDNDVAGTDDDPVECYVVGYGDQ